MEITQSSRGQHNDVLATHTPKEQLIMQWIDPAYCDIRLGFEVTAYVYVR